MLPRRTWPCKSYPRREPPRADLAASPLPQIVQRMMWQTGVPGITVAVVHRERLVFAEGYGVMLSTAGDGPLAWSHSGEFIQGASTQLSLMPDLQMGIVVLTNHNMIDFPAGFYSAVRFSGDKAGAPATMTLDFITPGLGTLSR